MCLYKWCLLVSMSFFGVTISYAQSIGGGNATGTSSTAVGTNSQSTTNNSVALDTGSVANDTSIANGAHTGSFSCGGEVCPAIVFPLTHREVHNTTGEVSVGSANNARAITNVADGRVTSASSDAINGAQLSSVVRIVNANAFRASINSGTLVSNRREIRSIESLLRATSTSVSLANRDIIFNRDSIDSNSTRIDVNAVTLNSHAQALTAHNGAIRSNSAQINSLSEQSRGGVAAASAFISPSVGVPGSVDMALGAGFFAGEQAYSVNIGYTVKSLPKLSMLAGAAFSTGTNDAYKIGMRYRFGGKNNTVIYQGSRQHLRAQLRNAHEQIQAQQKNNQSQYLQTKSAIIDECFT